jgi:beta-glucosidase
VTGESSASFPVCSQGNKLNVHNRFGTYSVDHSINNGLDLEMPGINKWRTLDLTNRTLQSRKLMVRTVKERARKTIELVQKCAQNAPEVCLTLT